MRRLLCLLIILLTAVIPYPASATSTEDRTVAGEGALTQGTYNGGGTFANMNSDDGATNKIDLSSTAENKHSFDMTASAVSAASFNYVMVTYSATTTSVDSAKLYPLVRIAGTNYIGDALTLTTAYSTVTKYYYTNPSTGLAWASTTAINAAEFGFSTNNPGSVGYVSVSYLKITISYEGSAIPSETTQAVTDIEPTTATGNGTTVSDMGSAITERGTVIAVAANPTTADHKDLSTGTTGAYTTSITALTKGTTYHVRAYAINATGTGYGTDVEFTTIGDPTITTLAATNTATTTARLNASVSFDGSVVTGEPCTVTFVYFAGSPYANYAAVLAAGGTEVVATGTYTQGQTPYYNVTGLVAGTLYSFAVKVSNATATDAYGAVLTFTASAAISDITNLKTIPTASTVAISWTKNTGADYTLVRCSTSGYPLTTADGYVAYLGQGNSYTLTKYPPASSTNLSPGTTIYFSAWGKTGALYSAGYVSSVTTTLAFDTGSPTGDIEAPGSNSWWIQTPSATKVTEIPMVSGIIATNATAYGIPLASLWYFLWILFSVGAGAYIFTRSGNKFVPAFAAEILLFALGAVIGLTMLWLMVIFCIIGLGISIWGDRR
jgi:hypothetical protein